MKTKVQFIYLFGAILLGFGGGVFASNWTFFKLDSKINLVDVISILITSIVGIFIAKTIQEQHSTSRSEKDFFIAETKALKFHIDKLALFASNNSFPFEEVKVLFKDMNQTAILVNELLTESENFKGIKFDSFLTDMRSLRAYITSKSPDANRSIRLSTNEKKWMESQLYKLKKDLYKILLNINS